MAESQHDHRQSLEASVINGNIAAQQRGTFYGFILAMTAVLGGIFLIYVGKPVAGLVSIIGALTALVTAFIVGKVQQKRQLAAKSNETALSK
jgi:uncharacterized membrane protein